MNRLSIGLIAAGVLALAGCKERLAPHVTPEPDPELLVAEAIAADNAARTASRGHTAPARKVTITVNNAPGPEQTAEHEILRQMVELFQKRHPNIQIQFSPWRYTPESFFERASSRALTDIVEIEYSQIPPVLDLNYAADITDLAASAPELADINPELMKHLKRDGRLYGIPGEMHTMALFYNRKLVEPVVNPSGKQKEKKTEKKTGPEKKSDTKARSGENQSRASRQAESSEEPKTGLEEDPEGVGETDTRNETGPSDESDEEEKERPRRPSRDSGDLDRRRGRGAEAEPRDYLTDGPRFESRPESLMARYTVAAELLRPETAAALHAPRVLAQYQQPGYYNDPRYAQPSPQYQQPYQQPVYPPQQQSRRARRGQQGPQGYYPQQQPYYQQPAPQPRQQPRRRGFFGWFGGQQAEPPREEMPPPAPGHYYPYDPYAPGAGYPGAGGLYNMEPTPPPRRRTTTPSDEESTRGRERRQSALDEDVLSTDPVTVEAPKPQDKLTTVVEATGLPADWDSFIRLAVKLTDHGTTPTYGYAPVLFAREGGREFAQWAIQAGLQIQVADGETATLDVNTTSAAMVAQFLKDLHWRYDVTPPPSQCYADNLMKLFAEGRIAMMMLPADRETIVRLIQLGFPVEDLGIAPLPGGPVNRNHLAFGRCYIINSQLDSERRAAALKWLLFQLEPEVIKMRRMAGYREQDWTGIPEVPLFKLSRHQELVESLHPYFTLPVFPDYYKTVMASGVSLEPPYFTTRLYEALAEGIRPIVENKDSDPMQAIAYVGTDFEKKYLKNAPTPSGLRRYLEMIPGL